MRRDARYEVASPDNELVETSPRSLEKAAVVQRSASVLVVLSLSFIAENPAARNAIFNGSE